jgi:hypothetical protein
LVANVALFHDPSLSGTQKNAWGIVLVSIIVLTILVNIALVMRERYKTSAEVIVTIPTSKVDQLSPAQQMMFFEMLFDFQLHQNLPADIPLKAARQMLSPTTLTKLWKWRNIANISRTTKTLQMTVGVNLRQTS